MIQEKARQGESARDEIARLRKKLARGRQREMDVEGFIEENGLGIGMGLRLWVEIGEKMLTTQENVLWNASKSFFSTGKLATICIITVQKRKL